MPDPKNQLNITLAEPVAFLRVSDPSGRLQSDPNDPPTVVRGILTLNVAKPIGISSIEVELTGVLTISYQEGIGTRRIQIPEKQKIYSSTVTIFRADQVPRAGGRRSASRGPGSHLVDSCEDEHAVTTLSRPPSLARGRSERRIILSIPSDLGPTPPYTVAQSSTSAQPVPGISGEHSARSLEELRQALRDNLEVQAYCDGLVSSPSRSHITSPLLNPMTRSNSSSNSNDSLHPEDDGRTDHLEHTSPSSLEGDTSAHNISEETSHIHHHRDPPLNHHFRTHSPEHTSGTQPHTRGNSHDPSNTPASHSRLRLSLTSVLDTVREITSRASSRSRSIARSQEGERGRTRVRMLTEEQSRGNIPEAGNGAASQSEPNPLHPSGHAEHRERHLPGLSRVFGLERDHEQEKDDEPKSKEHGGNWREFKPGTYSFPISFLLPPNLSPTFSLPYGSLNYIIKGVAHRPGTFTSKLSCHVPLLVVAAPAIGAGEGSGAGDPGPLSIQKEWQGKLAYSIGLSSRLFLLGSQRRLEAAAGASVGDNTESIVQAGVEARAEAVWGAATLDLTILPIEKIKIWRLDVIIDQRIRYADEHGNVIRDDDKMQVKLLELQDTCTAGVMDLMDEEHTHKNKHKHKHEPARIPLLPTPISPHRSPLLRYISPSTDPSILAGPGPYALSTNIGLPGCNGLSALRFTIKQKNSNVKVEHSLRLVMRVERVGNGDTNDHEEKKLVDIAIQTPITILSCRCVPEQQMLPRYSQITEDSSQDAAACSCHASSAGPTGRGHGHEGANFLHGLTPSSTSSFESEDGPANEPRNDHERSRSSSRALRGGHTHPLTSSEYPNSPSPVNSEAGRGNGGGLRTLPHHAHVQHRHSRSQSYAVSTFHVHAHSGTPPFLTPQPSRAPSPLARYERLVSGLESEAGEAPPSYESVASSS